MTACCKLRTLLRVPSEDSFAVLPVLRGHRGGSLNKPVQAKRLVKESMSRAYAWSFGRTRFRRMNNLLLHFALRGLGFGNWHNHVATGEDHLVRSLGLGKRGQAVVLDVGAYHGDYAKLVRR